MPGKYPVEFRRKVLDLTEAGQPCDGAWPGNRIALFQDWIAAGKPA